MSYDNIQKYLEGAMSKEECYAFELEMENDPFLREAVEGYEMLHNDSEDFNENELFADIHTFNREQEIKTVEIPQKKRLSIRTFALAAMVVGVLAGLWFIFSHRNSAIIDTDTLYSSYYKPLTHPDALVRGENESQANEAVSAYEKEDYFAAVNAYRKLVDEDSNNVKNKLFLGISYLSINQPQKAIEIFTTLSESQEYYHDIRWYLALAYLKTKQTDKAGEIFTQLSKEDNFYQENASTILDKLGATVAQK